MMENNYNKFHWRLETDSLRMDCKAAANSTYKKLAVQWLNEALCFVSSSVVTDNFHLRNRQLLVAANRYGHIGCHISISIQVILKRKQWLEKE